MEKMCLDLAACAGGESYDALLVYLSGTCYIGTHPSQSCGKNRRGRGNACRVKKVLFETDIPRC